MRSLTATKTSKRARILWRLLKNRVTGRSLPVFGVLTVNGSCNFTCGYCFADYHSKHDKALPLERMLRTVGELDEMGVRYLNVHGGEALLRNDIGLILDEALRRGMFVNLITNGALLKRRWKEVKGVDTLCVSLDGREENNDKNRGPGAYRHAVEAIDFALGEGMTVRVGMTITKHTQGDIRWVAAFAKRRGVFVHPYLLFDQKSLPSHLWMTPEENRAALRELIALKREGYPIFYSLKTLEYSLRWPYSKPVLEGKDLSELALAAGPGKSFKPLACHYKKVNVLVEHDGTVRTCNIKAREGRHESFLDGRTVAQAKEELHRREDCRHCYHLPQTEQSFLMQLDFWPLWGQLACQALEGLRRLRGLPRHAPPGVLETAW